MMKRTYYKEHIEDYEAKSSFIDAVVVNSITKEDALFIGPVEFLFGEFVNACVEYLTGNESDISYENRFDYNMDFETYLGKYARKELRKVKHYIKDIIYTHTKHDYYCPHYSFYNNFQYKFDTPVKLFKLWHCTDECNFNHKTFYTPKTEINTLNDKYVKTILEDIKKNVSFRGKVDAHHVGKLLRKYIQKDLEAIKK